MGFKYEVETFFYEDKNWATAYQGQSLVKAVLVLIRQRRTWPGRCYRLVVR